jgi:hypothetical protein
MASNRKRPALPELMKKESKNGNAMPYMNPNVPTRPKIQMQVPSLRNGMDGGNMKMESKMGGGAQMFRPSTRKNGGNRKKVRKEFIHPKVAQHNVF